MSYTIRGLDQDGKIQEYYFTGFNPVNFYSEWSADKDDGIVYKTYDEADVVAQVVNSKQKRSVCTVVLSSKIGNVVDEDPIKAYDRAMSGI